MNPGTGKYESLLAKCAGLEPVLTAVAHPCEKSALEGAIEACQLGLITPILVGPEKRVRDLADSSGIDLRGFEIVDAPHSSGSAAKAVPVGSRRAR